MLGRAPNLLGAQTLYTFLKLLKNRVILKKIKSVEVELKSATANTDTVRNILSYSKVIDDPRPSRLITCICILIHNVLDQMEATCTRTNPIDHDPPMRFLGFIFRRIIWSSGAKCRQSVVTYESSLGTACSTPFNLADSSYISFTFDLVLYFRLFLPQGTVDEKG